MNRIILHIDMDAFYASVEQLDHAPFRGKPVIVGGTSNRGVVSTASYEARKFGVHSAMPIFQAKQKCPHGIFLPVRMMRYKELSRQIMSTLERFTPLVEQISIDEAYLDISGTERLLGTPVEIGCRIKEGIKAATSLSCSVGIAPNKFLAKIASEMKKPDGLTIIRPDGVQGVIDRLPIEKVPGVGEKTVLILRGLGVSRLVDVRRLQEHTLLKKAGKFGRRLLDLSKGIDTSPVLPYTEAKSISSEDTLPEDTDDMEILKRQLLIQAELVGRKLRKNGLKGSTVTLKLKSSDFKQTSKSVTLDEPANSTNLIYERGLRLLQDLDASTKFRLIGIGISNLSPEKGVTEQLNLFKKLDVRENPWENVERAMDTIKDRFGKNAIKRGAHDLGQP